MPRKQQGWITFQLSGRTAPRATLPTVSAARQRFLGNWCGVSVNSYPVPEPPIQQRPQEDSVATEIEFSRKSEARAMKVSARNVLKGRLSKQKGAVNTEVTLEVAPGVEITSIITSTSSRAAGTG